MAHAIRFDKPGGPDVLRWEEVAVGNPGPGQVRLRHEAVGLNFADTYFRAGLYPIPMPNGIGVEAAGVVTAIGEGVTNVGIGDRGVDEGREQPVFGRHGDHDHGRGRNGCCR